MQDLRLGLRLIRRNPVFAATAVLTIALGVGATTSVFSVVYGVLLRPLPYPEPDRLVQLWTHVPKLGLPRTCAGAAMYRDWREQNDAFDVLSFSERSTRRSGSNPGRRPRAVPSSHGLEPLPDRAGSSSCSVVAIRLHFGI